MQRLAQLVIVITLPAFLLLSNVRLVASERYVAWEYGKPNFPPAELLTPEQRYAAAVATVNYVRGQVSEAELRALSAGGRILYNQREIRHLIDAKGVADGAFAVQWLSLALLIAGVIVLIRRAGLKTALRALRAGSLFTLGALLVLGAIAVVNFDWFFTKFHQIFFEGETWLFNYTDTLIQLYPLPFWFDAVMLVAALTLAEALLISLVAWVGESRASVQRT